MMNVMIQAPQPFIYIYVLSNILFHTKYMNSSLKITVFSNYGIDFTGAEWVWVGDEVCFKYAPSYIDDVHGPPTRPLCVKHTIRQFV